MNKEINYAGKRMILTKTYYENDDRLWDIKAQSRINSLRKIGEKACCIHEGKKHGFYEEKRTEGKL